MKLPGASERAGELLKSVTVRTVSSPCCQAVHTQRRFFRQAIFNGALPVLTPEPAQLSFRPFCRYIRTFKG